MSRIRLGGALLAAVGAIALLAALEPLGVPSDGGRAHAADGAPRRASPRALAAGPDGRVLHAALQARGTVAWIDVASRRVVREVLVGGEPRGLAVSPDGSTLAVSVGRGDDGRLQDVVLLLDRKAGTLRGRVPVGRGPEGLCFAADGRRLFVALSIEEALALVDPDAGGEVRRVPAGREPFAVARAPDGRTVAALSRRAAALPPEAVPYSDVTLVDARDGTRLKTARLPSIHLAEALAFTPDGRRLLVPGLRVRNLLPIVQVARGWVVSSVIASVDVATGDVRALPLTTPERGFADPAGLAVLGEGERLHVAGGGANAVLVVDLPALLAHEASGEEGRPEDHALAPRWILDRVPTGPNPFGVVAVRDGEVPSTAVSVRLDDAIVLLDADGGVRGRIVFDAPGEPDALLRGERTFHDAAYCFQEAFSCRSCHPEAHTDGLTYDFEIDGVGEHVVLNRSLRGLAGTDPYKWTGINPSLQRQCGARFAMVLTRARVIPEDRLDDMAAWLLSLPPPEPPIDVARASPAVRAAVERGRRIFGRSRDAEGRRLRPEERCITCHPPPLYTNRQTTDVGTRGERDPTGRFDTSHLLGVGRGGPYLHDGRAVTLEDIWRAPGVGDDHGKVSDLDPQAFADLMTFLRTL